MLFEVCNRALTVLVLEVHNMSICISLSCNKLWTHLSLTLCQWYRSDELNLGRIIIFKNIVFISASEKVELTLIAF